MFEQGSLVIYGVHGICKIIKFEKLIVDKKKIEYYVLESVKQPGAHYYVPTQNKAAVAK